MKKTLCLLKSLPRQTVPSTFADTLQKRMREEEHLAYRRTLLERKLKWAASILIAISMLHISFLWWSESSAHSKTERARVSAQDMQKSSEKQRPKAPAPASPMPMELEGKTGENVRKMEEFAPESPEKKGSGVPRREFSFVETEGMSLADEQENPPKQGTFSPEIATMNQQEGAQEQKRDHASKAVLPQTLSSNPKAASRIAKDFSGNERTTSENEEKNHSDCQVAGVGGKDKGKKARIETLVPWVLDIPQQQSLKRFSTEEKTVFSTNAIFDDRPLSGGENASGERRASMLLPNRITILIWSVDGRRDMKTVTEFLGEPCEKRLISIDDLRLVAWVWQSDMENARILEVLGRLYHHFQFCPAQPSQEIVPSPSPNHRPIQIILTGR